MAENAKNPKTDIITREIISIILGYIKPRIGDYIETKIGRTPEADHAITSDYAKYLGDLLGSFTYESLTEALAGKAPLTHTHTPISILPSDNTDGNVYLLPDVGAMTASNYTSVLTNLCTRRGTNVLYFNYSGEDIVNGSVTIKNGYLYKVTKTPFAIEQWGYTKNDVDRLSTNLIEIWGSTLDDCLINKLKAYTTTGIFRLYCWWDDSNSEQKYDIFITKEGGGIKQTLIDPTQVPQVVKYRTFNNGTWTNWTTPGYAFLTKEDADTYYMPKNENVVRKVTDVSAIPENDGCYLYDGGGTGYERGTFYENVGGEIRPVKGGSGAYVPILRGYNTLEDVKVIDEGCYNIIIGGRSYLLFVHAVGQTITQTFINGEAIRYRESANKGTTWGDFITNQYITTNKITD